MPDASISFKVDGLDKVLAAIDSYSDKVAVKVDDTLTGAAYNMNEDMRQMAPVDDSNLRQNIGFEDKPFLKRLYSNAAYSAYQEFGTGALVDVPTIEGMDLPAYAMTFFVNGKGHIPPHPFFFPAIQKGAQQLPEQLKKAIEETKP